MSTESFVLASLQGGFCIDTDCSNGDPVPAADDAPMLAAAIASSCPKFILILHNGNGQIALSKLRSLISSIGALECTLLLASFRKDESPPIDIALPTNVRLVQGSGWNTATELSIALRNHRVPVDGVVLDPDCSLDVLYEWLESGYSLLNKTGWIYGPQTKMGNTRNPIEKIIEAFHLNICHTAEVWLATLSVSRAPKLALPIVGNIETIRFASIEESVDAVSSRSAFLNSLETGQSCFLKFGGGLEFSNRFPENIRLQGNDACEHFRNTHFPSYEVLDHTEGHLISHLRDVKVAGQKGYLYSRHGELLDISFGIGTKSVKALKELVPNYEPILRKAIASKENLAWESMAGIFPPAIEIETPHVVAMWPDAFIYHHWVTGVLTRFWYLDEFPELANMPIITNAPVQKFQLEYLNMLGLLEKNRFVFFDPSASLKVRQAVCPSHFEAPAHGNASVSWLRKRFLKFAAKVPLGYENGLYYISRRDAPHRQILNEPDIIDFLTQRGFKVVEWSAHSVPEQIALAQNAKVIIGAHGSNMTNTAYIEPGCKVMDMRNDCNECDLSATFWSQSNGGKFYTLIGYPAGQTWDNSNHYIDFEKFKSTFTQMMDS